MRNSFAIVCSIIFFSCANTVETVTDESLDGKYRVTGIKGEESLPGDIIFSFNPVGNRVTGNAGCNEFSALYQQQGNNLEFSTPMNTRKFCEGKMDIERQILSSLGRASKLDRIGNEVVIFGKDDEPLLTLIKINQSE